MSIKHIYEKYKIPPNLQEHMIRVAAVGVYIVDHWKNKGEVDKKIVTQALLLHDMGNIVKFDLDHSPNPQIREKIDYWKQVQQEFKRKYGLNEHAATEAIAHEIGVSAVVQNIIKKMGVSSTHDALLSKDWNKKVYGYSDLRVDPYGVVRLSKRFKDILKRYKSSHHYLGDNEKMREREEWANRLEKQIQEKVDVDLQSITDQTIQSYLLDLSDYQS